MVWIKGDRKNALKAGCVGYIPKPVDIREFPGEIKNFLQKNKP
ncbi:protein containing FOG domain with CheY-like receiver [Candidatus Brocadia sinica JPN1]|uniref:Protein containing FOG domain with CheY-like receiver n=1 Tax=Candidatus Brocadia sinica JPN1 TaxID=1197129 RepID=A0ABQ0JSN8_9BACT|nr:protein containing FOG domain with CheY-like receiver [Candidatus Brocadia sinica JPN1]